MYIFAADKVNNIIKLHYTNNHITKTQYYPSNEHH